MPRCARGGFHPRIHGGNTHGPCPDNGDPLSSPHTRGEPFFDESGHKTEPFIPAYTGGTAYRSGVKAFRTFHPRIHGGNIVLAEDFLHGLLSSPHTRGERGH